MKLILRFLVGEFRKSTRHLYIPSSESFISSTNSCAGCAAVRKNARGPNAKGDDQRFACPTCRPLISKLEKRRKQIVEYFKLLRFFFYLYLCLFEASVEIYMQRVNNSIIRNIPNDHPIYCKGYMEYILLERFTEIHK